MKIKNVKPGDIIKTKTENEKSKSKFEEFKEDRWKVIQIYKHNVLAQSVRFPEIRRSFSYGDLVMLGLETQYISR